MALILSVSKGSVSHIILRSWISKVCTRWVPWSLNIKHKTEIMALSSKMLASFEAVRKTLSQIVTADETCVHCFELETKKALHGMVPSSISPKKNQEVPIRGQGDLWDCEGVILVDGVPTGKTVNSKTYIRTVTELRKPFKQVHPHKNQTEILLQPDNARLHESLKSQEAITKFGRAVLPQPSAHRFPPTWSLEGFNLRCKI
jgi:hypothetical protein